MIYYYTVSVSGDKEERKKKWSGKERGNAGFFLQQFLRNAAVKVCLNKSQKRQY